jgi:hypothetical protein
MPRSKLAIVNATLVGMARRCASGSISTPPPGRKWAGLARHSGYTITALVEELVGRAKRRVTARLPTRAQGLGDAMTGRVIVLGTVAMAVAAIGTTMDAATTPRFVWNASASVPIGLHSVHPARHLTVAALAVAYPPEPLAGWLAERRYLPRGVPLLKPVLALDGQTVCRVGSPHYGRWTRDGRRA